mmetsp:Transcript_59982/g.68208  ORF Transcript_59982/g.68208 Transcript_59982/m.68208 type:complete len:264 (+) Transcript_59982:249-1040(+)
MILGYVEFSMSWFPAFQHHTTDYIFRQVTYRFTFALFTFHIMMSLITLATDSCGRTFHETWYLTKTLLLIGSYVLVLCLEGSFWGDLGQWLPYLATAMFALEGVMFLFVAYDGNSVLVESERLASLLVLSGVFTVLSGFMLIYAYVHATHFDMVIVLIVATSMAGVSYGAALCLRCACERASLFVSSMVTFFISYVAWEAVMKYEYFFILPIARITHLPSFPVTQLARMALTEICFLSFGILSLGSVSISSALFGFVQKEIMV